MADANASTNVDGKIHESHNLSEAEIAENKLRKPYLSMSPLDRRYPHSGGSSECDDLERQLPDLMNLQNPERGNSPPIENLPAPGLPSVPGADAGVGTSSKNLAPPEGAVRKLSREERWYGR